MNGGKVVDFVDTTFAWVDTFKEQSMAVRPENYSVSGIVTCQTQGTGHKTCPSCGFKIRGSGHVDGPHHKQGAAGGVKTRRQSNGRI